MHSAEINVFQNNKPDNLEESGDNIEVVQFTENNEVVSDNTGIQVKPDNLEDSDDLFKSNNPSIENNTENQINFDNLEESGDNEVFLLFKNMGFKLDYLRKIANEFV